MDQKTQHQARYPEADKGIVGNSLELIGIELFAQILQSIINK